MISVSHLYSDLSAFKTPENALVQFLEEDVEDAKLQSFETGYKAGWDDAVKAQENENERITSDLLQHLQDMSFTYQEAYAKLTAGMQPLMVKLVKTVLPSAVQNSLGAHIMSEINTMIDTQAENVIEVVVAPEKLQMIEALIDEQINIPFAVTSEPTLSAAQVYLRVNKAEREINLDAVLEEVNRAVEAFLQTTKEAKKSNG